MSYSDVRDEEVTQRDKEIYDKQIRAQVETAENIGKIIAIGVETADYEIGNDLLATSLRLKSRHPNAEMWAERSFNAVHAVCGILTKTAP